MAFIVISCKSPENGIYQFDPRTLNENEITLSKIADEVTYVTLDNSIPLGNLFNIEFKDTEIFLATKEIGVLSFDRGGKFIRKIGSIGRGPGEYIFSIYYTIDDKNGTIYVRDQGQVIKVYSRNGQFVRSFSLHQYGENIDYFKFHDSKLFITYSVQFNNQKYKWIAFDTLGNVIKIKNRDMPIFNANSGGHEGIFKFENRILYWNQYIDTIFSILPDLREKPTLIVTSGEHRMPKSKLSIEQFLLGKYMTVYQIFETNRFFIIDFVYLKRALVLIEKHNQTSYLTYLETEINNVSQNDFGGIINDIDGGLNFLPKSYFIENNREYMVGLIDPYKIKVQVKSSEFKNSVAKYPEKKKELESFANNLTETDNQVLMIVRLK